MKVCVWHTQREGRRHAASRVSAGVQPPAVSFPVFFSLSLSLLLSLRHLIPEISLKTPWASTQHVCPVPWAARLLNGRAELCRDVWLMVWPDFEKHKSRRKTFMEDFSLPDGGKHLLNLSAHLGLSANHSLSKSDCRPYVRDTFSFVFRGAFSPKNCS